MSLALLVLLCSNVFAIPSSIGFESEASPSFRSDSNNSTDDETVPDDLNTGGIEEHDLDKESQEGDEGEDPLADASDRSSYIRAYCGYRAVYKGYYYTFYTTRSW